MTSARSFRFQRVYVEITNICNLRCDFCAGTTRPPASMDPEFFRRVLDQLAPLTDQVCLHVMGEPLLHPHLENILELCAVAGIGVNLTTNAALLHGKADMLMRAPALRQVNFSIQSLRRGEGLDHDTLERILEFSLRAAELRPELFINFRLWTLQSLNASEHSQFNATILQRIAAALDREIQPPAPGRKSSRLLGRIYLHTDTVFEWPGDLTTLERSRGFCHALSTHCAILVDGTVCPCCLDADARLALGNILDAPLTAILDSPRARAMAAGFAAGRLVEEVCRHCTYCRRFKSRAQR
ncbi:MAG: radical SAM/SPASM domain-containing protein [Desulfomicrobium apsheronum]|nr:radical SAM/SPASM domain-containing protein [Desulfomicrobium apsheronum]